MTETGIKRTEDLDVETVKVVAQSICSGDWICPDCSPQCGVWNYAIKALTGSKECVHCINPYQEHNYNYCPYCGRKLKGEKMKKYRVIAYPDEYGKPRKETTIQAENHKEAERIAFRLFPEYHEVGAFEMEDN